MRLPGSPADMPTSSISFFYSLSPLSDRAMIYMLAASQQSASFTPNRVLESITWKEVRHHLETIKSCLKAYEIPELTTFYFVCEDRISQTMRKEKAMLPHSSSFLHHHPVSPSPPSPLLLSPLSLLSLSLRRQTGMNPTIQAKEQTDSDEEFAKIMSGK